MIISEKPSNEDREIFEAGIYMAAINAVIDLGFQENTFEPDQPKQHKLALAFELDLTYEHEGKDKPVIMWVEVTASIHERAKLRPIIEAALGEVSNNLDTKDLLGKKVNLICKQNANKYLAYNGVAAAGKAGAKFKPTLKPFESTDGDLAKLPDYVPSWIIKKLNTDLSDDDCELEIAPF